MITAESPQTSAAIVSPDSTLSFSAKLEKIRQKAWEYKWAILFGVIVAATAPWSVPAILGGLAVAGVIGTIITAVVGAIFGISAFIAAARVKYFSGKNKSPKETQKVSAPPSIVTAASTDPVAVEAEAPTTPIDTLEEENGLLQENDSTEKPSAFLKRSLTEQSQTPEPSSPEPSSKESTAKESTAFFNKVVTPEMVNSSSSVSITDQDNQQNPPNSPMPSPNTKQVGLEINTEQEETSHLLTVCS